MVRQRPDEFELLVSPVTKRELDESPEPKRELFAAFLQTIPYTALPEDEEADELARLYVAENVLNANHIDDLTHVAYAVLARCDYIISWNRRHLVNVRTISRVNEVNVLNKFPQIFIATPLLITGETTNEND